MTKGKKKFLLIRLFSTALLPCLLAFTSYSANAQTGESAEGKVTTFVSVLPQKYLLERIAADLADVRVMVGPGQSPATYEPTPRQMTALGKARLYFRMGVPFEVVWMPKIAAISPGLRIVDQRKAIEGSEPGNDTRKSHQHVSDPHLWTSPLLARHIAEQMKEALIDADPANIKTYEGNCSRLVMELEELDRNIRSVLSAAKGKRFMVFHPAWGHFAREYGLVQIAIETEGKSPGPRSLAAVIRKAREAGIEVIYVQSQFSRRDAEAVARVLGARVAALDPLAEDYPENMIRVARELAGELR